jgi:hypothetical protein
MSLDVETNAVAASPRQARARGRLRPRLRRVLSAIASRFSSSLTRRILVLNLGGLVALLVGYVIFALSLPREEPQLSETAEGIVALTGGSDRVFDAGDLLARGKPLDVLQGSAGAVCPLLSSQRC